MLSSTATSANQEMASTHDPVMVKEVVEAIKVTPGSLYVDATWGRGGYTRALLAKATCHVLGLDWDPEASAIACLHTKHLYIPGQIPGQIPGHKAESHAKRSHVNDRQKDELARKQDTSDKSQYWPGFYFAQVAFTQIQEALRHFSLQGVQGVVFDLGLSSPQLESAGRGFSLRHDGPLDMRMSQQGESARTWLEHCRLEELAHILTIYGDERHAHRIAKAIVQARSKTQIATTHDLVKIIHQQIGPRSGKIDSATRTFQAIRIHINQELQQLKSALQEASACLRVGGRLIVVSYHSGEDRLVKHAFRSACGYREHPLDLAQTHASFCRITRRVMRPQAQEVRHNRRARSARMRVIEKIREESK